MPKVYVGGAEELIVALTALFGELPLNKLADKQNFYSKFYFQNNISLACRDKYVRKVRTDGDEYLRLSLPKGDALIINLSETLYDNFLLVSEALIKNPKARYKGNSKRKERRQAIGRAMSLFWELGFSVNGFSFEISSSAPADTIHPLKDVSSIAGISSSMPVETMISKMPNNTFISCHFLREEGTLHSKEESSRKYGLLRTSNQLFLVYYLTSAGYTWTRDIERFSCFRYASISKQEIKGIFLFDDMEIFDSTLNPIKISKSMCQPLSVFNDVYMIEQGEKGRAILKILKNENGERRILELIFPEIQGSNTYDGLLNGTGIINFLTCNIAKLKKAKEKIKDGSEILIVLCEYQKSAVIKYLKACPDAEDRLLVINDDVFISIAKILNEEGKNADI